ncbi:hypothetical protein [Borreliella valaisiana]
MVKEIKNVIKKHNLMLNFF